MKENWTYKKLGEICEILNGFAFKSDEYEDNGIRVMRITNVQKGEIVDDDPKFFPLKRKDEITKYILREGDVLMSLTGNVGRVGIMEERFLPAALNQRVACLRLIDNEIDKRYLFHILNSDTFENDCVINAAGIAQKNMSTKWLEQYEIPIPKKETQSRIVSELDLLQSIIDKQKAQLKELDNLAQAVFYDMFGDPVENEKGWDVKKLGEIVSDECPISYGIVQPGDGVENGIPVVRPVDMTHTFVYRQGLKQTTKEISNSYKRTILKGNEILLCVRGTTGLVSLATDELKGCNVTRGVAPIECNAQNDRWFVYFQFLTNAIQQYIAEYTKGIALKQINMKDVREIPFIVPPLSLQQSFAAKIESIEKQKAAIGKSIEETQKLFDYTMDKYFE